MLSLQKLTATAALAVGVATAQQINYYYDSGCTQYIKQINVNWSSQMATGQNNCYNFGIGGSLNIASCDQDFCMCIVYPEENCQGDDSDTDSLLSGYAADYNCVRYSWKFKSFQCFVYNNE